MSNFITVHTNEKYWSDHIQTVFCTEIFFKKKNDQDKVFLFYDTINHDELAKKKVNSEDKYYNLVSEMHFLNGLIFQKERKKSASEFLFSVSN